jgi:hypothetical protein
VAGEQAANTEACDALVEFNAAASGDSDTSTPEGATALGNQLAPLWEKAAAGAPASAKAEADAITAAIDDMKKGDPAKFEADETYEGYTKVLSGSIDACDFATTSVTAKEDAGKYSFAGLPAKLDTGVYAVTLKNEGVEPHVLVIFRKNDGEKRTAEELLALPEEEGNKAGKEVPGGPFAPPGAEGVGLATLEAGDYVYFCPIPIGGEDGPPHFTEGMFGEFTVE